MVFVVFVLLCVELGVDFVGVWVWFEWNELSFFVVVKLDVGECGVDVS